MKISLIPSANSHFICKSYITILSNTRGTYVLPSTTLLFSFAQYGTLDSPCKLERTLLLLQWMIRFKYDLSLLQANQVPSLVYCAKIYLRSLLHHTQELIQGCNVWMIMPTYGPLFLQVRKPSTITLLHGNCLD
jgi:hypothetical protein